MKPPTKPSKGDVRENDAFLRELREEQPRRSEGDEASAFDEVAAGVLALSESLAELEPPAELRARLLANIPSSGRFERFASKTAELLDIGLDKARALLDRLDDPTAWSHELPGISFFWVDGGPSVANAVRGFLRVQAGTQFPVHEHLGDEVILVIQGSFEDPARGVTFHPGDIDRMPAGSSHDYIVPKDGPDLVKLAITQVGARALGMTFSPR